MGRIDQTEIIERERRAAEIRQAFYAGRQHRSVREESGEDPARTPLETTKSGTPCRKQNEGWLRDIASKALSLAAVVSSPVVPASVSAERLGRCVVCPHCSERHGKHYCGCCGCPMWNVGKVDSALEYKVTKAGWRCPREKPAFGSWKPENDGLKLPV